MMSECDIRAMLRLVADASASDAAAPVRHEQFLRGLTRLAGGQVGLEVHLTVAPAGAAALQTRAAYALGVTGPNEFCSVGHLPPTHPASQAVLRRLAPIIQRWRSASGRSGLGTQPGSTLSSKDHCAFNMIVGPAAQPDLRILAVCRPADQSPFTERERQIVRLTHEQVDRIWSAKALAEHQPIAIEGLPAYLQRIVPELLAGYSEKQIAANLGFTFNTTHQYVKAIYRAFGVSSRAEFMARRLMERAPAGGSAAACASEIASQANAATLTQTPVEVAPLGESPDTILVQVLTATPI